MENFETERLRFRAWAESDAEDLFMCASDPDVGERAGWPPHQTVEDSLMVIKNIFSNGHTWALELKETGRVMEKCGFRDTGRTNILSKLYHSDSRHVRIMKLESTIA